MTSRSRRAVLGAGAVVVMGVCLPRLAVERKPSPERRLGPERVKSRGAFRPTGPPAFAGATQHPSICYFRPFGLHRAPLPVANERSLALCGSFFLLASRSTGGPTIG